MKFNRKTQLDSEIPTASMPDIIFMLLIFFMVTTVLREYSGLPISLPKAKRIEFRCPDPSSNPYLAFSAILMAGLDGVKNKIDPGKPTDINIYEASAKTLAKIASTPGSLNESLIALEKDHSYLLEGNVFTKENIETYISFKRENEVNQMDLRPHPYEFNLYYDA